MRLALLVRLSETVAIHHGRGAAFGGFSIAEVIVEADGSLDVRRPVQEGDPRPDIDSLVAVAAAIGASNRPQDREVTSDLDRALARADSITNLLEELAAISRRHRLATDREYTRNLAERSLPEDPQFLATMRLPRIGARQKAKSEPPPRREDDSSSPQPPPYAEAWTGGSIRIAVSEANLPAGRIHSDRPPTIPLSAPPENVAPATAGSADEPKMLPSSSPETPPGDDAPGGALRPLSEVEAVGQRGLPEARAVIPRHAESRSSTPTVRTHAPRKGRRLRVIGAAIVALTIAMIATFSGKRTLVVLLRMRPAQEAWFRSETLVRFEKTHGHRVRVESYRSEADVVTELEKRPGIDVVKVEGVMLRPLAERGLLLPIDRMLVDSGRVEELASLERTFEPVAASLARVPDVVGKPLYGAPRKVETQLLAFRKSRVAEVQAQLDAFLPELDADLTRLTGARLPKGYALEEDPNAWDLFDLLVLGYVWSKSPDQGVRAPRIMFRSYSYLGTMVRLLDALAGSSIEGPPTLVANTAMLDVFEWEALFRELGLYHPRMLSADAIVTGREIDEAMARNEVFLTETHTLDLRLLGGSDEIPGYVSERSDVGFALLPRRVSVAVDNTGVPLRVGTRRAHISGWVWAIPKSAPRPEESWELISELVSKNESTLETQTFWIQPARRDVALPSELRDVVSRQMRENEGLVLPSFPSAASYESFRDKLVGSWWEIVAERRYLDDGRISRSRIKRLLEERLGRP
ncbi:MAG: extracellular solute-binding protein [Deltaproteobacteria bacterium]|nr:extracellular solute-binding protein [Deltaproteobacteria bacterium]